MIVENLTKTSEEQAALLETSKIGRLRPSWAATPEFAPRTANTNTRGRSQPSTYLQQPKYAMACLKPPSPSLFAGGVMSAIKPQHTLGEPLVSKVPIFKAAVDRKE
jgi:hypothetical protein